MGKEQKIAVFSGYKLAIYVVLIVFAALFVSILSLDSKPLGHVTVTNQEFEKYFANMQNYTPKGFVPGKERVEVLLVHSYQMGNAWSERIIRGVQNVLYSNFENIVLDVEFLASRDYPEVLESKSYLEHLRAKINHADYKVVIVCDNNAFDFVTKHRDYLVGDIPIVFCGVNNYTPAMIEGVKNITGISEDLDFSKTVNLARYVFPEIKKVYFVLDRTLTGQSLKQEVEKRLQAYHPDTDYEFLDYSSTEKVGDRLAELGPESLVILVIWTRDEQGNELSYEEACEYFVSRSSVPVFGMFDYFLNHGIIGGNVAVSYEYGMMSAEIASEIIKGKNVNDIPVRIKMSYQTVFDYDQLQKFGIKISRLPEDAVIINYPENVFVQYKKEMLLLIVVFAFLSVMIILLAINVNHRRIIQQKLAQKQAELRALVVELASKNEELESIIYASYHDLRSPLININGFANELADTCKEIHESLKDNVKNIEGGEHIKSLVEKQLPREIDQLTMNAQKMSLLQSSLLEVSKIGQELLDINSVNVNSMICSILENMTEIQQGIVDVYIKTLPDCMADAKQIRRVFTSIIENAIKFRKPDRKCEIIIYGTTSGDKVMYSFEDNGIGIDPKNHADIFRLFYKINVGPDNPGMGLGLTIAKRIVSRHNGQIKVHSEVGKGTTFTVILPLKHDPSLR